jgi:ribose-phosphate pyrophosphokinase
MIDDMVDTAGSVTEGALSLKNHGAEKIYVAATHGIFSPPAFERIDDSPIEEVVVTNTLPLSSDYPYADIRVLSVAPLFAHAVQNVYNDESVSELFDPDFQL